MCGRQRACAPGLEFADAITVAAVLDLIAEGSQFVAQAVTAGEVLGLFGLPALLCQSGNFGRKLDLLFFGLGEFQTQRVHDQAEAEQVLQGLLLVELVDFDAFDGAKHVTERFGGVEVVVETLPSGFKSGGGGNLGA